MAATSAAWRPVYAAPIPRLTGNHRTPPGMLQVQSGSPPPADLPAHRRTMLHRQADGFLVREVWTDARDGKVIFEFIPAGKYYIIAFDHTGVYNGACTTDIQSELMPGGGLVSAIGGGGL